MGASLGPQTSDPEFVNTPRHEFNLWFDPEAAHIVLRAPWKKIVCTTVDISIKTKFTNEIIAQFKKGTTPVAQYLGKYARLYGEYNYLWDELTAAAWLDPTLITKKETRYMDIDLDRGAGYGNALTWSEQDKPALAVQPIEIQVDVDLDRFYKMVVDLLTAPTPNARSVGARP
jgi:inosine-uridine nucleoside N-ribohydrolase